MSSVCRVASAALSASPAIGTMSLAWAMPATRPMQLRTSELARAVARHKAVFFPEKDDHGEIIDYAAAISGDRHLVPDGNALEALAEDYARMLDDGLLLDDAEPFEELVEKCRSIEKMANAVISGPTTNEVETPDV